MKTNEHKKEVGQRRGMNGAGVDFRCNWSHLLFVAKFTHVFLPVKYFATSSPATALASPSEWLKPKRHWDWILYWSAYRALVAKEKQYNEVSKFQWRACPGAPPRH